MVFVGTEMVEDAVFLAACFLKGVGEDGELSEFTLVVGLSRNGDDCLLIPLKNLRIDRAWWLKRVSDEVPEQFTLAFSMPLKLFSIPFVSCIRFLGKLLTGEADRGVSRVSCGQANGFASSGLKQVNNCLLRLAECQWWPVRGDFRHSWPGSFHRQTACHSSVS